VVIVAYKERKNKSNAHNRLYEVKQALIINAMCQDFALGFYIEDKHKKGMWPVG